MYVYNCQYGSRFRDFMPEDREKHSNIPINHMFFYQSFHILTVRASYHTVKADNYYACIAREARHIVNTTEDKVCDKKEMADLKPCHARAAKAKHRWAFSARDYFFAGELRSWTNDGGVCSCIHLLQRNIPLEQCHVGKFSGDYHGSCDICRDFFERYDVDKFFFLQISI